MTVGDGGSGACISTGDGSGGLGGGGYRAGTMNSAGQMSAEGSGFNHGSIARALCCRVDFEQKYEEDNMKKEVEQEREERQRHHQVATALFYPFTFSLGSSFILLLRYLLIGPDPITTLFRDRFVSPCLAVRRLYFTTFFALLISSRVCPCHTLFRPTMLITMCSSPTMFKTCLACLGLPVLACPLWLACLGLPALACLPCLALPALACLPCLLSVLMLHLFSLPILGITTTHAMPSLHPYPAATAAAA